MMVLVWLCFCGGVGVVVFLLWRCTEVLWGSVVEKCCEEVLWCFCDGVGVVMFLWWCFCVFVVV